MPLVFGLMMESISDFGDPDLDGGVLEDLISNLVVISTLSVGRYLLFHIPRNDPQSLNPRCKLRH